MKISLSIALGVRFILPLVVFCLSWEELPAQGRAKSLDEVFGDAVVEPLQRAERAELGELIQVARVGDRDQRQGARRKLVAWGRRGETYLLPHLTSRRWEDARTACLVLGRSGGGRTLRVAREQLSRRASGRRVKTGDLPLTVWLLGALGNAEDVAGLLRAARRMRRAEERRAVVHGLGALGQAEALPFLVKEFESVPSGESRAAVLLAIGSIGSPSGWGTVKAGLASHKRVVERGAIVAAAWLKSKKAVPFLVRRLSSKHEEILAASLMALAHINSPDALEQVRKRRLLNHRDPAIRAAAALFLGATAGSKVAGLLGERLSETKEKDPAVRRALVFAWAQASDSEAVAPLMEIVKNGDDLTATSALLALGSAGWKWSPSELDALAESPRRVLLAEAAALLMAHRYPTDALGRFNAALAKADFPQGVRPALVRITEILKQPAGQCGEISGRLNTLLESLGGSVEWELLSSAHRVFLETERLHHPLGSKSGGGAGSGETGRPAARWTDVDEDRRLWLDEFPYYSLRRRSRAF